MTRYIKEFKGDYRVQYWKSPRESGHNAYYFDDEIKARAKFMELVTRQVFETMRIKKVVMEVLFDYGDDGLAFVTVLESKAN